LEECDVDQGDHVLGGEWGAFVDELAVFVSDGIEDEFAGGAHDFFGDGLSIAEVGEFGFIFGSAFHDSEINITSEGDAGLFDHVGVDQRQGSIGCDACDVVLFEALCEGLCGGDFAIAGEPARWGEIGVAIELVSVGGLFGAGDLDIAEDEDPFAGGELDVDGWIADREADIVEQGEVCLWDAGEDDGVVFVGHGEG